jgi:hypothetical protein
LDELRDTGLFQSQSNIIHYNIGKLDLNAINEDIIHYSIKYGDLKKIKV